MPVFRDAALHWRAAGHATAPKPKKRDRATARTPPCRPTPCRFLLPPIIFYAGLSVRKRHFFKEFFTISGFGIAGTYACFALISTGLWLCLRGSLTFGVRPGGFPPPQRVSALGGQARACVPAPHMPQQARMPVGGREGGGVLPAFGCAWRHLDAPRSRRNVWAWVPSWLPPTRWPRCK